MSLKTSTLRANFSLSGRPNPNNITPPTSPLRSRIRITKHTSRPYTPGNSKPKPNGVAGTTSGGVGTAGSVGGGGVGGSAAGTSTLGSGSGLGMGATAGVNAAGAAGKKAPSKHIVWYREMLIAMMPVIGIGTAIFFALQLIQTHLSHSRSLHDAQIRITHLESELAHLQTIQRRQAASWGDSLGRVIKHVQKVAVGPSTTSTSTPAAGAGAAGAEDGKGATDAMTSTGTGTPNISSSTSTPTQLQPTSTSAPAPLADKADQTRRTVKEGLMDVESGMESLVGRVKDEFGVAVNEDGVSDGGKKRGRGWRGWVGL
ncbi:hypothetical protein FFLO_01390 [Filobasidium floriforme]|uniref:Uncharacterized protein n=1 Tax=Filobasidium floriforme TaxID=5210 RepID=A0A8K0JPQ9_9TREE|nr:hypothetical protein FFLO_01390 [Filobasidium floriforme]